MLEETEKSTLPAVNGRGKILKEGAARARTSEPLALHRWVPLQREQHLEQRNPRLGVDHVIQNNERNNETKGIRSKLSGGYSVKVINIHNEGMERKSKFCTKKLLVSSNIARWT